MIGHRVVVAAAIVFAACSSDPGATTPTSPTTTTTPTTLATTTTITTTSPTTTTTTTTSPTTTPTTTPTSPTTTTTTTTEPPAVCDDSAAFAILDGAVEQARLEPGGAWSETTAGVAFDDRTQSVEGFRSNVTYDCVVRVAQTTSGGAERLALIGWNDLRHVAVIQATDAPSTPYVGDIVFQLFFEQPRGEWLVDQFVWAATMSGGESIVISTHDASTGLTAKSWQLAAPEFDDIPVTLDVERLAIDALRSVGARNVSVAEPASFGVEIGSVQFHTPMALSAFAVVAPSTLLDPLVPIVTDGDSTIHTIDGVTVQAGEGVELGVSRLVETGWVCGDEAWRLNTSWGTVDELLAFTETLIRSLDC